MLCRIAITDDSPTDAAYLSSVVTDWAAENGFQAEISVFPSAEAFLFTGAGAFDILLLDIEMGGMNGVELARALRADGQDLRIIFITGYPDFMSEGYEVSALHYLMKPVNPEKLCTVLDRAAEGLKKPSRMVVLTVDGTAVRIPAEDILYVEAFSHTLAVVTTSRTYELRMQLAAMEVLLGEGFVRCHRSYLVGLHALAQITKSEVTLESGQKLPLSRNAAPAVHRAFVSYYRRDNRETL